MPIDGNDVGDAILTELQGLGDEDKNSVTESMRALGRGVVEGLGDALDSASAVADLETAVAALDDDVAELQSDVSTLETAVSTLQTSVAALGALPSWTVNLGSANSLTAGEAFIDGDGWYWKCDYSSTSTTIEIDSSARFHVTADQTTTQEWGGANNAAPRLTAAIPEGFRPGHGQRLRLQATARMPSAASDSAGAARAHIGLLGVRWHETGTDQWICARLQRTGSGPTLVVDSTYNSGTSDTTWDSDSVSSTYFDTGTDLRLYWYGDGSFSVEYRVAGTGSYTALDRTAYPSFFPLAFVVILAHSSALTVNLEQYISSISFTMETV